MSWESLRAGLQRACVDTFALDLPATYRPVNGGSYAVRVIFRDEHVAVDVADGAALTSANPTAGVRRSDLQGEPMEGDELDVPAKAATYQVRDKHPDGEGMVELQLRKMPA